MAAGDFLIRRNNAETTNIPNAGTNVDVTWDTEVKDKGSTLTYSAGEITVPDTGPYLIIYNEEFATTETTNNERIEMQGEILINGSPIMGGRGQDYIRKGQQGHQECVVSGASITELTASDTIQIRFYRTDSSPDVAVDRVPLKGGLQVLQLDDTHNYGIYSKTTSTAFTTTFTDVAWDNTIRQDTGFTRTGGSIDIANAGRYVVTIGCDLTRTDNSTRVLANTKLQLDAVTVAGTRSSCYMRGSQGGDSSNDGALNGIWIIDVAAGEDLTLQIFHNSNTPATTATANMEISIWQLPADSEEIIVEATTGDMNAVGTFTWDTNPVIDTGSFTHTVATAPIEVDEDNDYLFVATTVRVNTVTVTRVSPEHALAVDGTRVQYGMGGVFLRESATSRGSITAAAILPLTAGQEVTVDVARFSTTTTAVANERGQFAAINLGKAFPSGEEHLGEVDVAGVGDVTSDASIDRFVDIGIDGTGTVDASANVDLGGEIILDGAGTVDATGTVSTSVVVNGETTIDGTGTIDAGAITDLVGDSTLCGIGIIGEVCEFDESFSSAFQICELSGVTGRVDRGGETTLEGTGTLDVSASVDLGADIDLDGTGVLDATASIDRFVDIDLEGTGTLDVSASVDRFAEITLDGSGTVNADALVELAGDVDLNGVALVDPTASIDRFVEIDIDGTGTLDVTASVDLGADVDINGIGSIGTTASIDRFVEININGTGTIVADATVDAAAEILGEVDLEGTGTLDVTASIDRFVDIDIEGTGTLDSTASVDRFADATLEGTGTLDVTASAEFGAEINLDGTGVLNADASVDRFADIDLDGIGTLNTTASVDRFADIDLEGIGILDVVASVDRFADTTLNGTGVIDANASVRLCASTTLSGSGVINATATLDTAIQNGEINLLGVANIVAAATADFEADTTLNGTASINANATLVKDPTIPPSPQLPPQGFPGDFANSLGVGPGIPLGVVSGNLRKDICRDPNDAITIKFKYKNNIYSQTNTKNGCIDIGIENIKIAPKKRSESGIKIRINELQKV